MTMHVPYSPPPVLVFDLDGTLADSVHDLLGALNAVLAAENLPPATLEAVRGMVGAGARALIERGLAAAGAHRDRARVDALFALFMDYYSAHIADATPLFPGVLDALDRFAAAGWRLAVCTNKLEGLSRRLIGALGITERFAAICGQDTFGVAKPDPRFLLRTIAAAGGGPGRAVMVGDSRADIDVARAAGVPVVAVDFGYTDVPVHALRPDAAISHFDDLWGAVAAVARVPAPLRAAC